MSTPLTFAFIPQNQTSKTKNSATVCSCLDLHLASHHLPRLPSNRSDLQVTPSVLHAALSHHSPYPAAIKPDNWENVSKLTSVSTLVSHSSAVKCMSSGVGQAWSCPDAASCGLRATGAGAPRLRHLPYSPASGQSSLRLPELFQNGAGGSGAAPACDT